MSFRRLKPLVEDGVVVGNVYDKSATGNPIAKWLIGNFDRSFVELVEPLSPGKILEVGCGEGRLTNLLLQRTQAHILGTDISDDVLRMAAEVLDSEKVLLEKESIYDLEVSPKYESDLVVCCEVLEHLEDPRLGLEKLQMLAKPYCLLSVPREPLWRLLNLLRGAYWRDLGNTPGHIQHWGRREFAALVCDFFHIEEIREPLPWTMILCKSKK